jgi:hypothetical protein
VACGTKKGIRGRGEKVIDAWGGGQKEEEEEEEEEKEEEEQE